MDVVMVLNGGVRDEVAAGSLTHHRSILEAKKAFKRVVQEEPTAKALVWYVRKDEKLPELLRRFPDGLMFLNREGKVETV